MFLYDNLVRQCSCSSSSAPCGCSWPAWGWADAVGVNNETYLDSSEKCSVGESSLNSLCPVTCLCLAVGFLQKTVEMPLCSGLWGALLFPYLPQLGVGNFLLCSGRVSFLEGSALDCWVGCGQAHGMGAECIPVALSAAPTYPDTTLAGGAEQRRGSCVAVVFYDCYLDKSQLHCGVMLIIVSTKLDLLSLPSFSLKLSLMIHCCVTFLCF